MLRVLTISGLAALAACASAPAGSCGRAAADAVGQDAAALPNCAAAIAPAPGISKRAVVEMTAAEYCLPENGFALGARGEAYAGLCAGPQAEAFLSSYAKGEKLYELERAAIAASFGASDLSKELWSLKRRIMQVETMRISTATPAARRADLARELKSLLEDKTRLEAELDALQARKDAADLELAAFRRELAARADAVATVGATRAMKASFDRP